jgi:hypothetical protein
MMNLSTLVMALVAQSGPDVKASEKNSEIINKLNAMSIDLDYTDAPFEEVITYIREFSGINIYVVPAVYEKNSKDSMKVSLKVKGVRLMSCLKLILNQWELAAQAKNGILEITTQELVSYNVVIRIYDIRDLALKINNFPGPRLELLPGAGSGGGPGVTFTLEEPSESKIPPDFLEELIRETCGKETWDKNPNASIQMTPNGQLLVAQTKDVHAEIERLVNMIREIK